MTTTTTPPVVPWRHRRGSREAARNRRKLDDATFQALVTEHQLALPPAPTAERVPIKDRPRLPVARPVMKSPRDEIRWVAGHVGNRVGHHAFRLDQHGWTFLCAAGRGLRRAAGDSYRYVRMPHHLETLTKLIAEGEREKHDRLAERLKDYRKNRRAAASGVAASALAAVLVLVAILGPVLTAAALAVGIPVALATHGRRRGSRPNPVMQVDHRPVAKSDPRPTADLIFQAFEHSGIKGVTIETAPHRVGSGWETVVRIPSGPDTFRDAAKAHAKIAGNLGTGSECLVLAPIRGVGGSEKHVRLWYTKTDPFVGDPPPHPLLDPRSGPADLWNDGLPLGIDQRGTEVRIPIVDTPFVNVVGQPGAGKSFVFLDIITGIASDPLWDLDCWTFKSSDDFSPAKPLVKACGGTYRCGTDDKTFEAFLTYLRRLRAEMTARNEALGELPIERRSKLKVERDLAADPDLVPSMRPRAVLVDEIITALESKWGPAILKELEEGGRTFRSQNAVLFLGSQFADSEIYKNLQKLLGGRICLSVARWQDSKGALGDRGHDPDVADASTIPLSDKAVAFVAGALDDPELGKRPTVKIRFHGNDLLWIRDHIDRQLAGPRAHQAAVRVDLAKPDPAADAFRSKLTDLFEPGETAVTCKELARRAGIGDTPVAARDLIGQARDVAGLTPRKDTSGKVTGQREASYFALEQLADTA